MADNGEGSAKPWCLFEACAADDADAVKEIMGDLPHPVIDEMDDQGRTALCICVPIDGQPSLHALATLLRAGATPSTHDLENGWTPLHRSLYAIGSRVRRNPESYRDLPLEHLLAALLLLDADAVLHCDSLPRPASSRKRRTRSQSNTSDDVSCAAGSQQTCTDRDGNTPLDILSNELSHGLHAAHASSGGSLSAYSFGASAHFQLGTSLASQSFPKRIVALGRDDPVLLESGKFHSASVSRSGVVKVWGLGKHGCLGVGSEEPHVTPVPVKGLSTNKVVCIALGDAHSVVCCENGSVWGWGANDRGQIGTGLGKTTQSLAPRRVEVRERACHCTSSQSLPATPSHTPPTTVCIPLQALRKSRVTQVAAAFRQCACTKQAILVRRPVRCLTHMIIAQRRAVRARALV